MDTYNYLLLSVYKNGVINCATYYRTIDNKETITSMNSGEVFYDLKSFVLSVLGYEFNNNEYEDCNYYDEEDNQWLPLSLIRN